MTLWWPFVVALTSHFKFSVTQSSGNLHISLTRPCMNLEGSDLGFR